MATTLFCVLVSFAALLQAASAASASSTSWWWRAWTNAKQPAHVEALGERAASRRIAGVRRARPNKALAVLYYSPTEVHARHMKRALEAAARHFPARSNVTFTTVDANNVSSSFLHAHGVNALPALHLHAFHVKFRYDGNRTVASIADFVREGARVKPIASYARCHCPPGVVGSGDNDDSERLDEAPRWRRLLWPFGDRVPSSPRDGIAACTAEGLECYRGVAWPVEAAVQHTDATSLLYGKFDIWLALAYAVSVVQAVRFCWSRFCV
ncbi:hypothetical protein PPROV_000266900 [Pycnococcus provasolii]|uniref:Thioredoxin domain-containing protein n=2 Tax=Pycnococcus provasolii TaxID=41880 RepID=A0A830HAA4_9CHLO|nr:hypothetical protein PPROV_000266900 [Pycnococcus provasolii]